MAMMMMVHWGDFSKGAEYLRNLSCLVDHSNRLTSEMH